MALLVQNKALDALRLLRPLATKIRRHDRELHDQLRDAMNSVVLNIAEGSGVLGGNGRVRFGTACGSAKEVRRTLTLAAGWGYVGLSETLAVDSILDEVCAMTWRLSGR